MSDLRPSSDTVDCTTGRNRCCRLTTIGRPNAATTTKTNSTGAGSSCKNRRIAFPVQFRSPSVQHGDADEVAVGVAVDVDADERRAVDDGVDRGRGRAAALEHALHRGAVVDAGE